MEKRMSKDVLIHVRGIQKMMGDSETEPIEIVVPGEYFFRNGNHYLRYEEIMEEASRPTVNYIKLTPKAMELRKKGTVNVNMVFEQGKKSMSYYNTPMGTLQLGIAATALEFRESEGELDIKVDYSMDMNDEHVADCFLTIQAQPKNSKDFVL
jgi:uncharacterized beta-barrel protein YwiB (DUF1934 family)